MTKALSPTDAHQQLDDMGLLDAAHQPGCYALRLTDPPDNPLAVANVWFDSFDAQPPGGFDGVAECDRLAYVGGSSDVYNRLMDHAEGEVRQTAVMQVWPPTEVLGVRATDTPFEAEYNYAREWIGRNFDVWCNGALL